MSNPSSFHLEYGQGKVLGYICTSRFCTLVGTEVLDSLFALKGKFSSGREGALVKIKLRFKIKTTIR